MKPPASAVNLKFLSVMPQARLRNFKFKTALGIIELLVARFN